jgi:hypothetical protein
MLIIQDGAGRTRASLEEVAMSIRSGKALLLVSAALGGAAGCGGPATLPGERAFSTARGAGSVGQVYAKGAYRGNLGAEFGYLIWRRLNMREHFDDGLYVGARYSYELGLNAGFSVSAGYYEAEVDVTGEPDLTAYQVRATIEIGSFLADTLSRWYVGFGPGYCITDDRQGYPAQTLPQLDSEWTAHSVVGVDIRNETPMTFRIEGGHEWRLESETDTWSAGGSLLVRF